MSEKIKLEQAMQDFGLVDKLSHYDYTVEISNHFEHNMYRLHVVPVSGAANAFLFRIHFSKNNVEIFNANEMSYFDLFDTNQNFFNIFQDFFSFLAKNSEKKLFIFRHNLKDKQLIRYTFSRFFRKDGFYNITDHATVKFILSFHEIEKRDICFIQELEPNTLPPIWNEGVAENVIETFRKTESTFRGLFDSESNSIIYYFFGYEGKLTITKNDQFHLEDEMLHISIPFSKNNISTTSASHILVAIEKKFRLQYLFKGTNFPLKGKIPFKETALLSIMDVLKEKYDLKTIHLKILNYQYSFYHFERFGIFEFEEHFFFSDNNISITHTTDPSVVKEHIRTGILNRLEDRFPSDSKI